MNIKENKNIDIWRNNELLKIDIYEYNKEITLKRAKNLTLKLLKEFKENFILSVDGHNINGLQEVNSKMLKENKYNIIASNYDNSHIEL